jgi:hypothetical protein
MHFIHEGSMLPLGVRLGVRPVVGPAVGLLLGALLVCGCGSGANLVPVSGTVTLDGQPLKAGDVQFHPDGSEKQEMPIGHVQDGKYELTTRGKKGAPAGRYKVVVLSNQFSGEGAPKATATKEVPRSFINIKYTTVGTTPLSKEVVANPAPDAYDLKLTK